MGTDINFNADPIADVNAMVIDKAEAEKPVQQGSNARFDLTCRKKMTKLAELGGGGGQLFQAMPERKRAFYNDVFPKCRYASINADMLI